METVEIFQYIKAVEGLSTTALVIGLVLFLWRSRDASERSRAEADKREAEFTTNLFNGLMGLTTTNNQTAVILAAISEEIKSQRDKRDEIYTLVEGFTGQVEKSHVKQDDQLASIVTSIAKLPDLTAAAVSGRIIPVLEASREGIDQAITAVNALVAAERARPITPAPEGSDVSASVARVRADVVSDARAQIAQVDARTGTGPLTPAASADDTQGKG